MEFFQKDIIRKIKTRDPDRQNEKTEKESLDRVMFDAFPGLIILVDAQEHTIADLNGAAADAICARKGEVIGQSCHNYIREARDGSPTSDSGNPAGAECTLVTTSGRSLPVLRSTAPVTLEGHPYSLQHFVDISVQKQIEEKLAAANSRIEAMKEEARVIADSANNDIIANIAHELRTPFNAIIGFTEMILDRQFGDLTPLQEEYLGDVAQSAHNLFALINDILDLGCAEGDKLKLEPSMVKLGALLPRCLALVKEKAAKHGIKLTTEINLVDEAIEADERKLKRILFNLITGALKSVPDGGEVRLKVEIREEDVCISIENIGLRIKGVDLEGASESSGQALDLSIDACRKTQAGLYLTRRLVELHGGRMWAESEDEGKGAAFRFLIPKKQNVNNSC